jgi:fucose permease
MMAHRYLIVGVIFLTFFVISFLTNILGPIIPDIIDGFGVSLTLAAVLPFCFFIAYGFFSVPAGFLVERYGEKAAMTGAFALAAAGALAFVLLPSYVVALFSLFVIGAGMAILQVAINPLLRVAGGEEHFAFNSVCAQLVFGLASFLSPQVYSLLARGGDEAHSGQTGWVISLLRLSPPKLPWVSIYWLFAAASLAMTFVLAVLKLPSVKRTADESAGTWYAYGTLLKRRSTWLYFISIVAYVGSEQGTADWMSQFLYRYHGIDPHTGGATAVAYFWGLLTAGCVFGVALLRLFDSRQVLITFSVGALAMLTLALFGPSPVASMAFPAVGLFASIMWPTIFALALNSVPDHHGPLSGILCTGIMGGALVPLAIGAVGDALGLRVGLFVLYLTLSFILSIGFWARPLVKNATIRERA